MTHSPARRAPQGTAVAIANNYTVKLPTMTDAGSG
jgi:hypothetical protein